MLFKQSPQTAEWKARSKLLKEAFGWRCALCRREQTAKDKGSVLTVHHIDGDSANDYRENLLPLCFSCHVKVDKDAEVFFHACGKQLALFEGFDYLSSMKELWWQGVQMEMFPEAQERVPELSNASPRLSIHAITQLILPGVFTLDAA